MSEQETNLPLQDAQNIVSYKISAQSVEQQQPFHRAILPLMHFPTLNEPPSQVDLNQIDNDNLSNPQFPNTEQLRFNNSQEIVDDDQDGVTIVSNLSASLNNSQLGRVNRRRKKRRKKVQNPLQIDSKQQSVEQIRQQAPKPVIQLEPESTNEGIENLVQMMEEQDQPEPQINATLDKGQNLTQQELVNLISKVLIDSNGTANANNNQGEQNSAQPTTVHFQQLFEKHMQILNKQADPALLSLVYANTMNQIEAADNQVVHIPKVIAQMPRRIIPLINQRLPQICQQYVLMTFFDLVTAETISEQTLNTIILMWKY